MNRHAPGELLANDQFRHARIQLIAQVHGQETVSPLSRNFGRDVEIGADCNLNDQSAACGGRQFRNSNWRSHIATLVYPISHSRSGQLSSCTMSLSLQHSRQIDPPRAAAFIRIPAFAPLRVVSGDGHMDAAAQPGQREVGGVAHINRRIAPVAPVPCRAGRRHRCRSRPCSRSRSSCWGWRPRKDWPNRPRRRPASSAAAAPAH